MSEFDPMDFERNSVGVLVVRVIRLKDIIKALACTEDFARGVVREIRGETSADGSLAFVLPSQLARWTYRRAGEPVPPPSFKTVLVKDGDRPDGLKRAARGDLGSSSADGVPALLKEVRRELSALKSRPSAEDSAVTVEEARRRLGCGRTRIFALLSEGKLRAVKKAGRRTMISAASIEAFLDGATPSAPRPPPPKKRGVAKARSTRLADAILGLPV